VSEEERDLHTNNGLALEVVVTLRADGASLRNAVANIMIDIVLIAIQTKVNDDDDVDDDGGDGGDDK
jgi:hypothetical protein